MSRPRRRPQPTALALTVSLTAGLLLGCPGAASAAGQTLFDQPFRNNTANGVGAVVLPGVPVAGATNVACLTAAGNPTGLSPRSCANATDPSGAGKLRLTDATTNKTGGVFGAVSVPTSQGLDVTFNSYQWGGGSPGADGLAFVLAAVDPANPTAPAVIGQPGGSLGYSAAFNGASVGLSNGYLGIGFDVFGNYSSATYQGTGCVNPPYVSTTGRVPGQVVVRGPGRNGVGYCAINSTATTTASPPLALRATSRAASVVPVEVVANTTASAFTTASGITVPAGQYRIRFTPIGGVPTTMQGALPVVSPTLYPSPNWLNASGYPKQLAFGWVGSTGSVTDYHEVDNAKAISFNPVPDLNVRQTSYNSPTPVPGDPVTYTITAGVDVGVDEAAPISVTQTLPTGVVPRGAFGSGWVCGNPSGQSITCVNSNGPFANGSSLPPITVAAVVTGVGVTPALIQTSTVVTASSNDANPAYSTASTPGTLPAAPSGITVTPASGPISGGFPVTVAGTNISDATAIQIGTALEQQLGTSVVLLPCTAGPAPGCFTVNANGTLAISSMPVRALAGAVNVTVVTRGASGSASYVYTAVPGAPTTPTAVAGVTSATVTWTAPPANGTPILGYVITPTRNGVVQPAQSFDAFSTSRTLTGLTAGASYTFVVAAVNLLGTGPNSPPSAAVVPYTLPGAPTITAAVAGSNSARISWTAPANGGSAIIRYTITPYVDGVAQPAQSFPASPTTATVTGLTAGTTYTFRISATNAAGTGPASTASAPVTVNPPPSLSFPPPPAGKAYVPYRVQLTVTGGTAPFVWSVGTGALPPGLTLDPASGLLAGTPTTAGSFPFVVQVTDASGVSATRPVILVIAPLGGLTISVPDLASLGTVRAGVGAVTGQLGVVTVTDDRGPSSGNWTAIVSITNFTSGAGSVGEIIPHTAVTYSSGPALSTTGSGVFVPQPGAVLASDQTAARWSGQATANSASWNPTLRVALPPTVVAGEYTATVTHSVF